jgi:hypothetical protein
LETELSDSDTTPQKRQPVLDDTFLETGAPLPHGGTLGLRLALPTSRESWARRRLFTLSSALSFQREWRRGTITYRPRVGVRAAWHAATEQTALYDAPAILGCDPTVDSCEAFTHSGIRSTLATFIQSVGVEAAFPHDLSATVEIWWVEGLLYPLADAHLPDGRPVPESGSGTRWRLSNLYLLGLEWRASPGWRLGAGLQTLNPQRAPDGRLYPPFLNRTTQLYVSASRVF